MIALVLIITETVTFVGMGVPEFREERVERRDKIGTCLFPWRHQGWIGYAGTHVPMFVHKLGLIKPRQT